MYLCPQTLWKMHPDQDELFGEVLRRDEQGVLVLIDGERPGDVARGGGRGTAQVGLGSPDLQGCIAMLLRRRLARTLPDV